MRLVAVVQSSPGLQFYGLVSRSLVFVLKGILDVFQSEDSKTLVISVETSMKDIDTKVVKSWTPF